MFKVEKNNDIVHYEHFTMSIYLIMRLDKLQVLNLYVHVCSMDRWSRVTITLVNMLA